MKILLLAPSYPNPGHPFGGIFNERSAIVLNDLCDGVEVLVPRPYAPPFISSCSARWKIYSLAPSSEVRSKIRIHRPGYPQVPKIGGAFWIDVAAFYFCQSIARKIHHRVNLDAVLSFDLIGAGGLAWRIGQDINIPAAGWATGGDLNSLPSSSYSRAVARTLQKLDIVFYQNRALLDKAAALLGQRVDEFSNNRHMVLPRGVALPECRSRYDTRREARRILGITEKQFLVLYVGRLCREKGVFDLLDAISMAVERDPKIRCVLVGSHPAFDETTAVRQHLAKTPAIKDKVTILPACAPDQVWKYLCAADIFAFASHHEGMPNSLLEAMGMGVPAVAFGIPPVLEIDGGASALEIVPVGDTTQFARSLISLAQSSVLRLALGERARRRVLDRFLLTNSMAEALGRLSALVKKHMTMRTSAVPDLTRSRA